MKAEKGNISRQHFCWHSDFTRWPGNYNGKADLCHESGMKKVWYVFFVHSLLSPKKMKGKSVHTLGACWCVYRDGDWCKNKNVFRVLGLSFEDTRVSWRAKSGTPAHTPKMWTLLAGYKLVCSKAEKNIWMFTLKNIAGLFRSEGRFM